MPKPFRDLSRRQKNRRLFAYRRSQGSSRKQPEFEITADQESSTTEYEPHISAAEYESQIPAARYTRGTENSILGTVLSHTNTYECAESSSEKTLTDENNDCELDRENSVHNNAMEENIPLAQWLSRWAMRYNIRQNALTPLLQDLHTPGHIELPRDARTLLRTPRKSGIESWSSGSYFHYGLEKSLIDQLTNNKFTFDSNIILMDLNIDGLPLSKSSKSQLWPILGKMYHEEADQPFVVGAYHGTSKPPSVSEFLAAFIDGYENLHRYGFDFNNEHYIVKIRCIICDARARSYISCTKNHNAYFGCGKCMEEGHYEDHRMLFLNSNSPLRTDDNFRHQEQEKHHTGYSPFERISVGMVSQFPNDPLHLFWLGITKKLLGLFLHGYHTSKLSAQQIRELSRRLIDISQWIPEEFARKPRGLDEMSRWKGTEFRLFALYIGSVVLQGILPHDNLMHFNTFSCAARILSHPVDCYANNQYAHDLLVHFVETFKFLYGEHNVIYNVHNLIHIHDDVKKFGSLDNFSAWPFENFMQSLKNMLRKKEKPLCQLYNRLTEKSLITQNLKVREQSVTPVSCRKTSKQLPLNCTNAHERIQFNHFQLSNKEPNNCCLLKDKSIVLIEHIGYKSEVPVIICRKYTDQGGLPVYPCPSENLDVYVTSRLSDLKIWNLKDIENKTLRVPFQEKWCIIPFLHSGLKEGKSNAYIELYRSYHSNNAL